MQNGKIYALVMYWITGDPDFIDAVVQGREGKTLVDLVIQKGRRLDPPVCTFINVGDILGEREHFQEAQISQPEVGNVPGNRDTSSKKQVSSRPQRTRRSNKNKKKRVTVIGGLRVDFTSTMRMFTIDDGSGKARQYTSVDGLRFALLAQIFCIHGDRHALTGPLQQQHGFLALKKRVCEFTIIFLHEENYLDKQLLTLRLLFR